MWQIWRTLAGKRDRPGLYQDVGSICEMFFKVNHECEKWLSFLGEEEPDRSQPSPLKDSPGGIRISIEGDLHRSIVVARRLVSWLGDFDSALFWIREYKIWPSSENWHLYYRLRSSYADHRQLHEAPGHLVLGHEKDDLVSLIQLALLFGWGGHLLAVPNITYSFLSHDGWIHLESEVERGRILSEIDEYSLERVVRQ